ncbi:hypothetical protein TrLO_g9661 [Triparma laevis f. longispina]|uniref:Uncharacterized protein n=1 Tax=Triparma laevis f. longispina TaxID=1714387 RepID=A0A9W7CD19_9STRA|nr:hypothetical protein TrLO_g9661 [Triparma laevis f. longispina]
MLERTLYRSLLRLTRQYDSTGPSLTSLIHRSDTSSDFSYIENTQERSIAEKYHGILSNYLKSEDAVLLTPEASKMLKVTNLLKSEFRNNPSNDVNIDTSFLCLKELSNKIHWSESLTFNETGDEIPSSLTGELGAGKFLLAHPLLSGYFSRSVIALTDVGSDTRGFVINQVSDRGSNNVLTFKGGPRRVNEYDEEKSIEMICENEVKSSKFIETKGGGFWIGGEVEFETENRIACTSGITVWGKGQLEEEIKKGFWILVSSEIDLFSTNSNVWSGILKGAGMEEMGGMGEGAKVRENEEVWVGEEEERVDAPSDVHVL